MGAISLEPRHDTYRRKLFLGRADRDPRHALHRAAACRRCWHGRRPSRRIRACRRCSWSASGWRSPYLLLSAHARTGPAIPALGALAGSVQADDGLHAAGGRDVLRRGRAIHGPDFWWIVVAVVAVAAFYMVARSVQLSKNALPVAIYLHAGGRHARRHALVDGKNHRHRQPAAECTGTRELLDQLFRRCLCNKPAHPASRCWSNSPPTGAAPASRSKEPFSATRPSGIIIHKNHIVMHQSRFLARKSRRPGLARKTQPRWRNSADRDLCRQGGSADSIASVYTIRYAAENPATVPRTAE